MKPLVYIAGPYTNPDPVANTRLAIQTGMRLYKTGLAAVEIPHLSLLSHIVTPQDLDFWYEFDLDKLAHCHFLWRMEGASTGADAEVEYALKLSIPSFFEVSNEWDAMLKACEAWDSDEWSYQEWKDRNGNS